MNHIGLWYDHREKEKQFAFDFVDFYYGNFNRNVDLIANAYTPDARITINGSDFDNFWQWIDNMSARNITSLDHHLLDGVVQVVNNNTLLITLRGTLTIGYSGSFWYFQRQYHEEFVLRYSSYHNSYFITNHILNISDM